MRIRSLMTASCVSLLALLLLAMPALAGVTWCRADPIVELNGTEVQVWVAIDSQYEHLVSGPVEVTVFTPSRIDKRTTFLDAGFNGFGEEVNFRHRGRVSRDGSFPVEIRVSIPVDSWQLQRELGRSEIPIRVEVISGDGQLLDVEGDSHGTFASLQVRGTH